MTFCSHKIKHLFWALVFFLAPVSVVTTSTPAYATCQLPTTPEISQVISFVRKIPLLDELLSVLSSFMDLKIVQATLDIIDRIEEFVRNILDWLFGWVDVWIDNFKRLMRQISAAIYDLTRTLANFMDVALMLDFLENLKGLEAIAHRDNAIDEGLQCTAATTADALARSSEIRRQAILAYTQRATEIASNTVGAQGALGSADYAVAEVEEIEVLFCDPKDNGGVMPQGCVQGAATRPADQLNADIKITEMVFEPGCIDIRDDIKAKTLDNMFERLVGMAPAELMGMEDFTNDPSGFAKWQQHRGNIARMNVGAMGFMDVVGRRMPGSDDAVDLGAWLRDIQNEVGTTGYHLADSLSPLGHNPCMNEILETLLEERLSTAQFYAEGMKEPKNMAEENAVLKVLTSWQTTYQYEAFEKMLWMATTVTAMELEDVAVAPPEGTTQFIAK